MKRLNIILIFFVTILASSCSKDYLETKPSESITDKDVFASVKTTQMALEGIHRATYAFYNSHDRFGQKSIDCTLDAMGEDFYPTEKGYGWFFAQFQWLEHRNAENANLLYCWSYYYDLIASANMILANIDKVPLLPGEEEQAANIKAQSLVYRAYSHYYLVQLYADAYVIGGPNTGLGIPYMEIPTQTGKARNTIAEVYTKIKADLDAAMKLFTEKPYGRTNKSQIDLSVAQAIAARVSLTTGDYANAIKFANAAAAEYTLSSTYGATYEGASLIGSWNQSTDTEWMWGANIIEEQQTSFASWFSHADPYFGGYNTLGNQRLASTQIYDFMSDTDMRKSRFKTISKKPRVGFKFTSMGDWSKADYLYIKSGEMYLIAAEAQCRLGLDPDAQQTIFDLVSKRDPAYTKPTLTGEALLSHILMQRRCDMWGDGQRFLDLKRLNKGMDRNNCGIDLTQTNGTDVVPAGDKRWVFLIPKKELDANKEMVQNPL